MILSQRFSFTYLFSIIKSDKNSDIKLFKTISFFWYFLRETRYVTNLIFLTQTFIN